MDMNKSFVLRKEDRNRHWHVIDAADRILGRLSTEVADLLRGKGKTDYTPHTDNGDYVVVTNCQKVKLTGDKLNKKTYTTYSGWRSGLKNRCAKEVFKKDPTQIIKHSVRGMLPKNKQSREVIKRLKLYVGDQHPHEAQV